jgi:NADP-dependent aldehyde dehydrogenase
MSATSSGGGPSTQTERGAIQPTGRSIVACVHAGSATGPVQAPEAKFYAIDPHSGRELSTLYLAASPDDIEAAGWAAWRAFHALGRRAPQDRAALLDRIAHNITNLGESLLAIAADETGLGAARLVSERDRTVHTLRMFARLVAKGDWVDAAIDTGQPSRRPTPRPDLRRMLRPLGPVAVFGAGNFPLAYSTAGGDTASALAAGCPVVIKGHPGHPGTGELVARCVAQAVIDLDFDPGTFSFLHSGGPREIGIGQQLVKHPAIRAVGFTGSVAGGLALARIAGERPDPIPVFAEMGSTNPVFVLPGACEAQQVAIAERLAQSAMNSGGQMCTCPGLLFLVKGAHAEDFLKSLASHFNQSPTMTMLYPRVQSLFGRRVRELAAVTGVDLRAGSPNAGHAPTSESADAWQSGTPVRCSAVLFKTTFDIFRRNPTLHDEVFGPAMLAVLCDTPEQMLDAAASVHGSLTGTIWAGAVDADLAMGVQAVLEQRVGRLIYNGVPTGVEVAEAMIHGGPYPATNQAHTTSVGPLAIKRWCRPVCYQNTPEAFLPPELRASNPLGLRRLVNDRWQEPDPRA